MTDGSDGRVGFKVGLVSKGLVFQFLLFSILQKVCPGTMTSGPGDNDRPNLGTFGCDNLYTGSAFVKAFVQVAGLMLGRAGTRPSAEQGESGTKSRKPPG